MKFLIIASLAESLTNFRGELIKAIQQQGYEVHAIAPDLHADSDMAKTLRELAIIPHNVEMQRTGTNPIADLKTLFAIRKLVKQIKPQFVFSYTIKPVIYGNIAAWLAGSNKRTSLITGLGYAFQGVDSRNNKRSFFQNVVHEMYQFALSKSDLIFFQNPDDKELFSDLGLLAVNANVDVVNGSGVDTDKFAYSAPLVTNKKLTFLLIARLLGAKGVREYARAASELKQQYENVSFDLVGWIDEGNPDAISAAELSEWQDSGAINYLGKLSDVRSAIEASHVYVLPSYREGTPRTVLEAMSMGRAVVTTDVPGCRETVLDGQNGFLVEVKSVSALKVAMEKFIRDASLVHDMGLAARKIAEQKYDVHVVNAHMIKRMGV